MSDAKKRQSTLPLVL